MPVRVVVTADTSADCTQAVALIDGIAAQFLLADCGYDSNEIIDKAIETGCEILISPKGIVRYSVAMIRLFIE